MYEAAVMLYDEFRIESERITEDSIMDLMDNLQANREAVCESLMKYFRLAEKTYEKPSKKELKSALAEFLGSFFSTKTFFSHFFIPRYPFVSYAESIFGADGIGVFMKDVKITVMRKCEHRDLMEKYENPIEHACDMKVGMVFVSQDAKKPEGLCEPTWRVMEYYVRTLAEGGGDFFDGWMKDPHSAMISCDDGFRPVSFYLETIE